MARKNKGLSQRHKNILSCIRDWQEEKGYPPSIREIGAQTQITSTSVVNYYLNQLEEMGYIERQSNVSRGINLIKDSTGTLVQNFKNGVSQLMEQLVSIPLVGRLQANTSVLQVEILEGGFIAVVQPNGNHFTVASLVGAPHDNDIPIIDHGIDHGIALYLEGIKIAQVVSLWQ